MTRLPPILARLALSLCIAASATAAEPDDRDAPTPEAVLRDTRVADGFVMELVAMEPAVVDPVAVTFDEHGTPFVVEYRDYPSGPPAGSPPLSRVVRLNDADGDGRYESSTPVAEHLPFSQGILALRGGLLVTASPDVLLLTDSDGDGTLDTSEIVATGFRVGNPQLRAACPTIGPDNAVWISGGLSGGTVRWPSDPEAAGVSIDRRDLRLDLARGTIRAVTGFGQFGNAFDSRGHRFTVSNRNPLMVSLLPPETLARNALIDLGPGYTDAAPSGADSRVAAVAKTNATAISHTGTHTSACGLTIFRGDLLGPEADGDAFTCEPVSHAVVRRRPIARGAGFWSTHP
jgi:putative membrane-bound dehydrogenase-like protein